MDIYDRGLRLRTLRKKQKLSQSAVGKRLGITRATVSSYERNVLSPSLEVLEKMALLYRTSVDYILGLENRSAIYIDDLTESQQETVRTIVETLRREFQKETK